MKQEWAATKEIVTKEKHTEGMNDLKITIKINDLKIIFV